MQQQSCWTINIYGGPHPATARNLRKQKDIDAFCQPSIGKELRVKPAAESDNDDDESMSNKKPSDRSPPTIDEIIVPIDGTAFAVDNNAFPVDEDDEDDDDDDDASSTSKKQAATANDIVAAIEGFGTTPSQSAHSTKKNPRGTTTARQKKKTKTANKIKVDGRFFSTRKERSFIIEDEQHKSMKVFGTAIFGNTTKGYTVQFDMIPSEHKRTTVIRVRLTTLSPNDEECNETTTNMEYTTVEDVDEDDEGEGRQKIQSHQGFIQEFCKA
jgi:hypothetical protein